MANELPSQKNGAEAPLVVSTPASPTPASTPAPAPTPTGSQPEPSFGARVWKLITTRPDPLSGVALTLPVFLVYHLGILLVPDRTGSDLVSSLVFRMLDASVSAYVITTFGFALGLAAIVWFRQKRGVVPSWAIGRLLVESAGFALLLLVTLGWATSTYKLSSGVALSATRELSVLTKLVLSCGSGFHEELVFRALLVTGGSAALMSLFQMRRPTALAIAVIVSSLAFGLAQYIGPFGHSFVFDTLFYRALLGVAFAILYLVRGFASAVYTHVLFSALVFFVYA
jgi:hypothetical protein